MSHGERRDPPMEPLGRRTAFRISFLGRRLTSAGRFAASVPLPGFNALAAILLGSTAIYGLALGGQGGSVVDGIAQPLGFSIDNVDVSGNAETSEIDVLQALWSTGAQSLVSLDVDAARRMLEAMPWIERASVAKTYPDRVRIALVEKRPFALWQKERELFVIDREGREIMPFGGSRFASLPFVVGPGANADATGFIDAMETLPELRARVRAYVRVGERRWDLRLDNGLTVRLPEDGAVEAAADLAKLDKETGLLSRDIAAVDMRIPDRIAIRLTPEALKRRDAAVKERDKQIKRSQKEKPA